MKKRFLLVGALATTLTFGGLFTPKLVKAATPATQAEEENNDYYVLPNGEHFLTKRTLKNGKTLEFYDVKPDDDSKMLDCKARYEGEEFQLSCYSLTLNKADIQNPGYDPLDKSTQKFSPYANPETYFPALTATKKVNDLIQKYKDPSKSMLPENVDKTSELYLDMKSCADEAIKDCKTEYDKIITLSKYVKATIKYDHDIAQNKKPHINLITSWKEKRGVCENLAAILERLCQIEGIPAHAVGEYSSSPQYNTGHAATLAYDSQNDKWIFSDPTWGVFDWSVYSYTGTTYNVISNVSRLKLGDSYLSLNYNYSNKEHWDEMENWTFEIQGSSTPNLNLTQTELDGIPITAVSSESLRNNTEIKSVVLPSSITDVVGYSFWNCTSLEEIDLSQTKLTSIPDGLFKGCTSLKTVKLPDTITSIGDEAFYDCRSLTNLEGLEKCKITSIGKNAFIRCNSLESLDFSQATLTSFDDEMFYGFSKLKEITFPETLTTIGKETFAGTALTKVELPASLTTIGEYAFESCKKLETVDLSKTQVAELPSNAFVYCSALTQVDFPSTLTKIGANAFTKCLSMSKLDLSNTALTTLDDYAFSSMTELTRIILPESLSSVGKDVFTIFNYPNIVPTIVSGNVLDKVNYTEDDTSPWRRRAVMFVDSYEADLVSCVRFYANGGSGTPVNPIFATGNARIKIPACTFTKNGYLFTGWNTKVDGSGTNYKANYSTYGRPKKLYAQWKKSRCEVTFMLNGGTLAYGSNEYEDQYTRTYSFSAVNNPAYIMPKADSVVRNGYRFGGWYKEEDFSGNPVTQITFDTAEDMTLYAKWTYTTAHTHEWEDGECTICHKKCEHSNFSLDGEKAPTCKEEGFSGDKVCNDCGLTFEKGHTLTKTDNHQWDKGKVTKEPSCKEEGEILYTCSVCNETKVETLAKTDNHQWGEWINTTKPSCSAEGKESRTCKVCSKTEERAIPTIPHTAVKEADKAATCTEAGYKGREYCSVCNTTIKERTIIPATGHEWREWHTTLAQTCATDGKEERVCSKCSKTEERTIPATGHTVELVGAKDSTCTSKGYSGDEVCKTCGETIKTGHELPLAQHILKKEEDVAATCTKDGHEGNTVCEVCKQVITTGKVIPKLGHDWSNEDGKCTRCGESHEHSYGEGTTIKGLTCTQDEEIDYECSECGYIKKEITKATGHEWGEWQTTLAQTCTTDGKEERVCSKCSEKEERTLKATGHKSETVGAKAPTCKEDGYTGDKVCNVCHETLNKGTTIPKTDSHEWGKWTTVRGSTCTENGEQRCKCAVCGEEEIESLPLAKHSWDNGKVTKAPSYTKVGVKTWTCSECGRTKTTTLAKLPMPKAGTKVIVGGNQYTVTKAGSEVRFSKANAKARAITVPSTIKAKGITYKVTSIGTNAFKNCKKLTKATIGVNVKVIKAKAFNNCPKLKTVIIKTTKLTKKTASKKCFSRVSKRMVIKSPKKVKKAYTKIFKGLKVR